MEDLGAPDRMHFQLATSWKRQMALVTQNDSGHRMGLCGSRAPPPLRRQRLLGRKNLLQEVNGLEDAKQRRAPSDHLRTRGMTALRHLMLVSPLPLLSQEPVGPRLVPA